MATRPAAPTVVDERAADVRERAIDAVLTCIARHGLSKTTIDDVAREAGYARATLYRYFGTKRALVALTVAAEGERISSELRAAAAEHDNLEDAVVAVMTQAGSELANHAALQFLFAFEPELILPFCTFDAGDRFLSHAGRAITPCFERFVRPDAAGRLGEWIARVTLAYCHSPDGPVDLRNERAVRSLVSQFIVPAFPTQSALTKPSKG
jgi:AcrR family transcriptional regulator